MGSSVLTELSMLFLVAGGTLWLASWALAARARAFRERMQAMLALSGRVQDPLDLPERAWPVLRASGWHSLQCTGTWFGQPWQRSLGASQAMEARRRYTDFAHRIDNREDISLTLTLRAPRMHGEAQLLAQQMARVFAILMESLVRERSEALAAALAQRAQLSLYLQHDMRNLCQWVAWVGADFAHASTQAQLLATAERLQRNAPLAQERAQRLLDALRTPHPEDEAVQALDLRDAWMQASLLAGLELVVCGNATVRMGRHALARVLDNLLTNAAQAWRAAVAEGGEAPLQVHIGTAEGGAAVQVRLHCPMALQGAMADGTQRLFEPFSSGRPGGLGLGLYQARKTLQAAGGDLQAQQDGGGLLFCLRLPGQAIPDPV